MRRNFDYIIQISAAAPTPGEHQRVTTTLSINDRAPDFELADASGNMHRLSDYRGQPVVLVFYPMDFSGVCAEEHACFVDRISDFNRFEAQVLGISVDHRHAHAAFAKANAVEYPLLSDFHPKGAVGRRYGVYLEDQGFNSRTTFVVDPEGRISFIQRNPIPDVPEIEEVLEAVEAST